MATMLEKIHTLVEQLSPDDQQQVLELIQELAETHQEASSKPKLPPGTSSEALLKLHFSMSPEDIEAMERALEDCERIEPDEDWLSA